jgi:hypothetical protein
LITIFILIKRCCGSRFDGRLLLLLLLLLKFSILKFTAREQKSSTAASKTAEKQTNKQRVNKQQKTAADNKRQPVLKSSSIV